MGPWEKAQGRALYIGEKGGGDTLRRRIEKVDLAQPCCGEKKKDQLHFPGSERLTISEDGGGGRRVRAGFARL